MPVDLQPILMHMPAFLLVLFRLTGIFIFAPLFGANSVPVKARICLALTLAFCIYPIVPSQNPVYLTVASLPMAVGSELLIGLAIGYGASLPLIAMQMGGLVMAQQMGLGFAQLVNPENDAPTDPVGQMLFLGALTIFLLLNGHHAMLTALVRSFQNVPLGGYVPNDQLLTTTVGLLSSMYDLAVRLSAPLLCLIFLETVAMGFIAKTVPQLNILSLGFPVRIIVGLFMLALLVGVQFDTIIDGIRMMLDGIFHLISPI
jgi:flagellar biosynthetic protein FliR